VFKSHLHAEVAPWAVHLSDVRPDVSHRVVLLSVVHPGDPVEAPDGVHAPVVGDHSDTAPPVAHGYYHGPLTRRWFVVFGRVEALLAVEAASDVYFTWNRNTNSYNNK